MELKRAKIAVEVTVPQAQATQFQSFSTTNCRWHTPWHIGTTQCVIFVQY